MKLVEVAALDIDTANSDMVSLLRKFIKFAKSELGLDSLPKFRFYMDSDFSVDNSSFGGYSNGVIYTMVANRHINDVCRSIAHEMVHYRQDLENRIEQNSGDTGSEIENEANYIAGIILRKWGRSNPHTFSLPPMEKP